MREDILLPLVSWRELQTKNWWFPLKFCIFRMHRLSLLRWGIQSLHWWITGSWARMVQLWGFREVSWSLQPRGRWELTISIRNESQSNCCDVLQICLYSFSCVVILNVKRISLNISSYCIPSDQRACERRTLSFYRSGQWSVSVTSLWCWVGFRCRDAEAGASFSAFTGADLACKGLLGASMPKAGIFAALLNPFTPPAETTRFYSSVWLCGCSFSSGK